jgi:hypothetical protein
LCCLFFNIQILITLLASSNSSSIWTTIPKFLLCESRNYQNFSACTSTYILCKHYYCIHCICHTCTMCYTCIQLKTCT